MKPCLPLFILTALMLNACSHTPPSVRLDPVVSYHSSNIGQSQELMLQVSNEAPARPNQIRIENSPTRVIEQHLVTGFKSHGFTVMTTATPVNGGRAQLKVVIRQFDVKVVPNTLKDKIEVSFGLELKAQRDGNSQAKTLSANQTLEVAMTANESEITGEVNRALGKLLNRVLADDEILTFLSRDRL